MAAQYKQAYKKVETITFLYGHAKQLQIKNIHFFSSPAHINGNPYKELMKNH